MKANFEAAVRNALNAYADMLGCSFAEAVEYYRESESTRDCIAMLVLAQADPEKLRAMAK